MSGWDRATMFVAACCFGGNFIVSAFGVWWHQIWLIYLGYGVLGGIGLGAGLLYPARRRRATPSKMIKCGVWI